MTIHSYYPRTLPREKSSLQPPASRVEETLPLETYEPSCRAPIEPQLSNLQTAMGIVLGSAAVGGLLSAGATFLATGSPWLAAVGYFSGSVGGLAVGALMA